MNRADDSSEATPRRVLAESLGVTTVLLVAAFAAFTIHFTYVSATGGASLEPFVRAVLTCLAAIGIWELKGYIEPGTEAGADVA